MNDRPATLAARMEQALAAVAPSVDTTADRAAAAAISCLREALERCEARDAALPLLAADALVTAACEGADGSTLRRLADELAPARLAELLPR